MFSQALSYERFMGRWSRMLAERFVAFAALPAAARVLDVGSGTGNLARAIVASDARAVVVGIDPSPAYVAHASAAGIARATFAVGDACRLDLPGASFAAAAALLVLNFVPDQRAALAEMRRVVVPGGLVAAAVWDHAAGMTMLRTFWEVANAVDPTPREVEEPQPLLERDTLTALWHDAGLRDVVTAPLEFEMGFSSFADYWEPFTLGEGPAGAFIAAASQPTREAIERELRSRLLAGGADRSFALATKAWAIRGVNP